MSDKILDSKPDARITALAYGTWLLTSLVSVLVFIAGREMIIRSYARFFPWAAQEAMLGLGSLSLINILVSMPLAMLVIAIIIGGFEFQYHNMGKPEAWRFLARTLAVELGILMLAWFI